MTELDLELTRLGDALERAAEQISRGGAPPCVADAGGGFSTGVG